MKIYQSKNNDPYFNLAMDEALLRYENLNENILYIYQNDNCIIIGKNQNAYAEINNDFVKEKNIKVSRRISGGGAVYQDMGNVCFSFISHLSQKQSFSEFLSPIVKFLNSLGLNATFEGKNDIKVNGFKISGNAQYIFRDRIMHHGTLLFDSNLKVLSQVLKVNKIKLESKAINSTPTKVSNIKDLLKEKIDTAMFIKKLINFFIKEGGNYFEPSDEVKLMANKISKRNSKWDWNYGQSPNFSLNNTNYYLKGGLLTASLNVSNARIKKIKIYGDFLAKKSLDPILNDLCGTKFNSTSINTVLNKYSIHEYFGSIPQQEIVKTILGEKNRK